MMANGGDGPGSNLPEAEDTERSRSRPRARHPNGNGLGDGARTRRDDILDEATRLFAARGFDGASMSELATAVGMRKASLFYHFASKEELYGATVNRLVVVLGRVMGEAARAEGSHLERLDALSDKVTGLLGTDPYAARLLLRVVMDWGAVMQGALAEGMMSVLEVGRSFLASGQQAREFREGDPHQFILSVLGVYFLPFAVADLASRLTGKASDDPTYIEGRRASARRDARAILQA
jgi:AcrR family transcriptional regulator